MSGVGAPENQCCVGVDGWCGARVLFTIVQRPLGSRCPRANTKVVDRTGMPARPSKSRLLSSEGRIVRLF